MRCVKEEEKFSQTYSVDETTTWRVLGLNEDETEVRVELKDTDIKGIAEIIIAKQRNGPIGTVKMAWIPEQTRFADLLHNNNGGGY